MGWDLMGWREPHWWGFDLRVLDLRVVGIGRCWNVLEDVRHDAAWRRQPIAQEGRVFDMDLAK